MIRNYLKVAFRYLSKHKGYTFINVLGLAVGIACCILIMLFVRSEWNFNRFHPKGERIYRAWLEEQYQGERFRNTTTPVPLVPVLQAGLPEAEAACRVADLRPPIRRNNHTFNDPVGMVDSTFFQLFHFPLLEGDVQNPFPTASSLVITQSAAKRYFGNENPIGKNLELELGNSKVLFTVSALAKDPPLESTIQFDLLIPFSNAPYVWSEKIRNQAWSNVVVSSYFLLKKAVVLPEVHQKIASILNPLVAKNYKPGEYNVRLQPLQDIHFNATLPDDLPGNSDPKYAYILATIGVLILLIACINFITLSIGRSATRALEVGVRKVLGAERQQLIRQFWGEAFLLSLFALVVGVALAFAFLKPFNQLANRELYLPLDGFMVLFCLLLVAVIGLIAGMYPAFILSRFRPIQVLKGRLQGGRHMGFLRKTLIVGQFVASIIMTICTLTVGKQLDYLQHKNLGYYKDHVIVIPTNKRGTEGANLAQRFEVALQKNPQIVHTTTALYSMAEGGWMQLGYNDHQNVFRRFRFNAIDADFVTAMGLQIVAGRDFLKNNPADSNHILVNEALVREYGWQDPIGKKLPGAYTQEIIGVVKDFHFESLHNTIQPVVLALKPDAIFSASSDVTFDFSPQPRVSVRFRGGNLQDHIAFLKTSWRAVAGDQVFEFRFLDDTLNAAYQQEQRLAHMVKYASFLSIFVACMGLFGLATLVVVRRTKEIGIRKLLGADVSRIVALLSKDFVVLVVVAALIAFPVAWWALDQWMQDFAYRIGIPWWVFIAAAVLALMVAVGTVSIQAIKAALANPVKSLRTE